VIYILTADEPDGHLAFPISLLSINLHGIRAYTANVFTIKWESVTAVGSKTRLTYIIESILSIQSTSNGTLYD
jgi:hypothetical protein